MGTPGTDFTGAGLHSHTNKAKWLSSDLRRRKSTRLSSPSTSTTSRVTARLMPSMPVTSSAPVTSTPPLRPSMRSVVDRPREPSSWVRLTFPMYKACKDSKDQGGFHDFVEILKLYDKNGDDTMIGNELFRL